MPQRVRTTVVGSYPVPSWLVGNTSRLVLRDAVMAVLKTQELAGIDLVTDGELMRFDPSHPENKWDGRLLRLADGWNSQALFRIRF